MLPGGGALAEGGSRLGWWVAAAIAFGWWYSDSEDARVPVASPRAVEKNVPSVPRPAPPTRSASDASSSRQEVPDAIARPTSPSLSPTAEQVLYTTTRVRLRAEPTTSAPIIVVLEAGQQVRSVETQSPWHRVAVGGRSGWVHGDYLKRTRPVAPRQQVRTPIAPLVRSAPSRSGAGAPIRDAYVGRCDCPYDLMRNGRRCGGNSAYSRPGGRSPVCYR